MPENRMDLREIARAVLNDLPQDQRLALMTEMMVEASGAAGLHQLSKARAAIGDRMQQLIEDRFPVFCGVDLSSEADTTVAGREFRAAVDDNIHWVNGWPRWSPPKLGAAQIEAICESYVRAGHEVPDAIAALRRQNHQPCQASDTGRMQPSPARSVDAPDAVEAMLCFPSPVCPAEGERE